MDRDSDPDRDVHQLDADGYQAQHYAQNAVAVVGMACRFSGAESLEQLWKVLETGASRCTDIPKDRFPDSCFERRGYRKNFRASFMDDIDAFDHKFFNVSSREASFRDPQQRLALEVTYQALESAGYFAREIAEEQRDVGVYMAICNNEYHENVVTHKPSAFSLTGSTRPFVAGQVSHFFGLTGPSFTLDAACATSGIAVNIACRAVASGECNSAIVGGSNLFISPDSFQDLAYAHFISPTGPSKSFDAAADGYGRGEGVAVIFLKRLSDALREGDIIKGVISATTVNQCVNEGPITVPHGPTQSTLYRKALQLAHLDAHQIGYVEAHGTGTRVGDPIEAESIRAVFGNVNREPAAAIYMGSLKSTIGHTEACAGLAGLIKVMLMIEKGIVPRQALFTGLNPDIAPLEPYGLKIPTTTGPWISSNRIGCVNNYGATGSNAVMIVAQAPVSSKGVLTKRANAWPISITAFSQTSLKSYCSALLTFVDESSAGDDLAQDIAFHLSRRRNPELPFTINASVSGLRGLRDNLISAISGAIQNQDLSKHPTVLFFGGQDGKTPSVSRALYDSCVIFRRHLDDCNTSLQALGICSMLPNIFESDEAGDTTLIHAKLFSVQYASAKAWIDSGIQPSRLVGHSFGQLTALAVSGTLSLQDALHLVVSRARLVEEAWGSDPGSMIAIEATQDELSELLERHADLALETACYNAERGVVLSGTTSSVDFIESKLLGASPKSHRFKRLRTSHAFHSVLSEPLIKPLEEITKGLNLQAPKIPLETCSEHSTWATMSPALIASHIREPVFFHQAVQRIANQYGPCLWIEAGTGENAPLLRRALGSQASSHHIKSVRLNSSSFMQHLAELTADLWKFNLKVQFWPFHQDQRHEYQILNLPPYQFDKSRHWLHWQDSGGSPVTEIPALPESKRFLRLVQQTKSGFRFEINTRFESWETTCSQNRILGISSCPVSLVLKLLSEAIGQSTGGSTQEACINSIQQMELPRPIAADIDGKLFLDIGRSERLRSWTFNLTTASEPHCKLADGAVTSGESQDHSSFVRSERLLDFARIQEIEDDSRSDRIRGRGIYKIAANKFEIPKAIQVIREVSTRGNEVATRLASLPEDSPVALDILIHIGLICLNGMYECSEDEMYVNTSIGDAHFRLSSSHPKGLEGSFSVYLKFFELGSSQPTCDVYVFNSRDESISAIILDVVFVRVAVKALHRDLLSRAISFSSLPAKNQELPNRSHGPKEKSSPETQAIRPSNDHFEEVKSHAVRSNGLPDLAHEVCNLLVRIADLDAEKLHGKVLLADVGIDSLMWMEIANEINKSFAVEIDMTKILLAEDLEALIQLIANQATGYSYNPRADSGVIMAQDLQTCTSLAVPLVDAASEALNNVREDFDILAKEAGCDNFWSEIHPVQTRLLEAYILEAFEMLSCDIRSLNVGDKIPTVSHRRGTEKLLKRLMVVLRDTGLIVESENCWHRTERDMPAEVSSARWFERIQAQFPKWAPEHELLHVAGTNLAGHLGGTTNPLKVLFGTPERRKLMADQYLVAPIQSTVSRQLSSFIERCLSSQVSGEPIQILEVGGGTCGTSLYVLEAIVRAGIAAEYTFTDISPSFIVAAKSKLKDYDFVKYRSLDISEEPATDIQGQYDIVLATNVIHATPDAGKSAGNVRKLLRGGGVFVMVEYTRIYAAIDVIFGQLDGWWLFDDGRTHAIMSEIEWDVTLKRAGYGKVDWTGSKSRESEIARIFVASS